MPDGWVTTAIVIRETGKEMFGVSVDSGQMIKRLGGGMERRVFRGRCLQGRNGIRR